MIRSDLSLSKNALNFGALTGLVIAVIQLASYLTGNSTSQIVTWTLYIVQLLAISWSVRKYRDLTGGFISYGQSLGFGVLLSLGASLVTAFANYLYIKFLDPEFLAAILEQMEIAMYETGYDDKTAESMMELYRTILTPGMFAIGVVFNFTFLGFIASLVISFFVRRNKPFFEQ